MDIDSDSEAEQVALELTQAQEWVCAAKEAGEVSGGMEKTGGGEEGEDHGSHKVGCGAGCGVGGG